MFDLSYRAQLRNELESLREEPGLILDMSRVSYLHTSCVSELVRLQTWRVEKILPKDGIAVLVQHATNGYMPEPDYEVED